MMQRFNQVLLINSPEMRKRGVDWCNDHGINPDIVPLFAAVEILDQEHLELEVYDTNSQGQKLWDEKNQRPKMRWLHVKVKEPIPEELLEDMWEEIDGPLQEGV